MVIHVLHLGLVPYNTALQLQRTLLELRKTNRIDNTLLLLEHPPVITLGRNAKLENVIAPPEFLSQRGVELFDVDRGGDVTFHGPGQLVAYPIFDLRSFEPKVGAVEFVRRLEEVLIRTCSDFGIALNVGTDLDFFSMIVPCGITNRPVTSMERELQKSLTIEEVATAASRNFGRVFQSQMLWLESLDDLLAQAACLPAAVAPQSSHEAPANQDTPARPPKELRDLVGDGGEMA
jgi:lipoyl(octanoyl) transferase